MAGEHGGDTVEHGGDAVEHGGYAIRIAEQPGRLVRHALRDLTIRDDEARATFSGTCTDAAAAFALSTRMSALGLEVSLVRISRSPLDPAAIDVMAPVTSWRADPVTAEEDAENR